MVTARLYDWEQFATAAVMRSWGYFVDVVHFSITGRTGFTHFFIFLCDPPYTFDTRFPITIQRGFQFRFIGVL